MVRQAHQERLAYLGDGGARLTAPGLVHTRAAVAPVGTRATVQEIATRTAREAVPAPASTEPVVATAPEEAIAAVEAQDAVIAGASSESISGTCADDIDERAVTADALIGADVTQAPERARHTALVAVGAVRATMVKRLAAAA